MKTEFKVSNLLKTTGFLLLLILFTQISNAADDAQKVQSGDNELMDLSVDLEPDNYCQDDYIMAALDKAIASNSIAPENSTIPDFSEFPIYLLATTAPTATSLASLIAIASGSTGSAPEPTSAASRASDSLIPSKEEEAKLIVYQGESACSKCGKQGRLSAIKRHLISHKPREGHILCPRCPVKSYYLPKHLSTHMKLAHHRD